jgi:hypothetical protein
MAVGTMMLHRFNGEEIYEIEEATISSHKVSNGIVAVTFLAKAGKVPLKTLPDTISLRAQPFAEVILHMSPGQLAALGNGQKFLLPKGYDEETSEYLTNFYYCEHEPMDDNEVVILERSGAQVSAQVSGSVVDVNFYDGSKPRTKVVVNAMFTLA